VRHEDLSGVGPDRNLSQYDLDLCPDDPPDSVRLGIERETPPTRQGGE
jgi:hypothetical protein